MSGFLLLLFLGAAALGLLWLTGLRGSMWTLGAAALLFGAAGYALQGRPGLAGSPAQASSKQPPLPLANARHAFFGQFTSAERWLILSDSYARRGKSADAVGAVRAGLRAQPDNYMLWVGLGNALTDHARMLTPAAELAFDRARLAAPWSPAPGFFHGLAKLRSGDPEGALEDWRAVLAAAPAEASWRPLVEDGVAMIERGRSSLPQSGGEGDRSPQANGGGVVQP